MLALDWTALRDSKDNLDGSNVQLYAAGKRTTPVLLGQALAVNVILWIIIASCAAILYWLVIHRAFKHFVHYPVPAFATPLLDNPIRRMFQPPQKVVDRIDIEEGMKVLEVGPGPGTFTIEAARRVGARGGLCHRHPASGNLQTRPQAPERRDLKRDYKGGICR